MNAADILTEKNGPDWPGQFFSISELRCKGSHRLFMPRSFLARIDAWRGEYGRPIQVVSGYRSPGYNQKVGGAPNSYHLRGRAVDVSIVGLLASDVAEMVDTALAHGLVGNGFYRTFIHFDDGSRRIWVD